ncbi:MAG TPA: molybdopterin molybdotransferase MoeA [Puia sp.]|nr:molybdopterin molybdotransferase MoeA [Puia sp.]
MIDYRQAQQLVLQQAHSFGHEEVPLGEAFGRVLAEPVYADRDYPPFPRATMDGYALRYNDLETGIRKFTIAETVFAGDNPVHMLSEGECYKIMTGAAVPESADIIIRREDIEEGPTAMILKDKLSDPLPAGTLPAPANPAFPWRLFQNIARRGEDLRAGAVVIDRNCRCEPAVMGLLATLGRTKVKVERLPRITLLTTGNEVVPVEAAISAVQIRNSNRWLIEAALKKEGIGLAAIAHVPDDQVLLRQHLEQALAGSPASVAGAAQSPGPTLPSDIVILCGGVSAGDADYVPGVLEDLGVKKLFHKMAIRPGKPTWCGIYAGASSSAPEPRNSMIFALPGNPFSCLVNTILLIQPYLQVCFGLPAPEPQGLPMGEPRKKRTPLDEFFPAHLSGAPARLTPVTINGSGDIRLGRQANTLVLHPAASGDLGEGDEVLCYSFV